MVGLSAMFPRVEVFLIQGSPVDMLERPPMDGSTQDFHNSDIDLLLGLHLHCSIKRQQKWLLLLLHTKVYNGTYSNHMLFVDYLLHVAKLNQLLVLSQQLEEDIRHLGSHKYIAHQLSVIYVSSTNLLTALH